MPGPAAKWTLETCRESALKYSTKQDWRKSAPGAYQAAYNKGFLDACTGHMPEHAPAKHFIYTLAYCLASARQYATRIEWAKEAKGAYQAASRHGWIKRCCRHMRKPNNRGGRKRVKRIKPPGGMQYKLRKDLLFIQGISGK